MRFRSPLSGVLPVYTRSLIVLASALIVLVGAAARASGQEDSAPVAMNRPPLAIYRPVPLAPLETVGADAGPMIRARLAVDSAGRVTGVQILSVDPRGPLDLHFRRAALRGLHRWRFRPGLVDGQPAPADVTVSIRFEARTGMGDGWRLLSLSMFRIDSERERRRLGILALPEELRRAMREEIVARGERLLHPGRRREASSEHFTLITDVPTLDSPGTLATLESAWVSCQEILGPRIPLQPAPARILAFGFSTQAQYDNLAASLDIFERSAGFYHPAGVLAAAVGGPDGEDARITLLHEAAHAFIDVRVVRPGVGLPRWLHEGLATDVGLGEAWDEPGRTDRAIDFPPTPARLKLGDLIGSTAATYHGDLWGQFYGDSWRAVRFLRHGGEGWSAEQFPRLILYLAEGYGFQESFLAAYGVEPRDLEEAFHLHAAAR